MRTITEIEEIEFAIQESRHTTSIVHAIVPDLKAALAYLHDRYDCGACRDQNGGVDVWSEEIAWRLWLTEFVPIDPSSDIYPAGANLREVLADIERKQNDDKKAK